MKIKCRSCGRYFFDDPIFHICPECEETLNNLNEEPNPQSEWKQECASDDVTLNKALDNDKNKP